WWGLDRATVRARRLLLAVAASFGLLVIAGAAAIVLALQAAGAEGWVTHTLEVRQLNEAVFARIQDATLGERGYLITEDRRYLAQFEAAKSDAPKLLAQLADLTRDNEEAQRRVGDLRRATDAQLKE